MKLKIKKDVWEDAVKTVEHSGEWLVVKKERYLDLCDKELVLLKAADTLERVRKAARQELRRQGDEA